VLDYSPETDAAPSDEAPGGVEWGAVAAAEGVVVERGGRGDEIAGSLEGGNAGVA
jgi:hypothetical protein